MDEDHAEDHSHGPQPHAPSRASNNSDVNIAGLEKMPLHLEPPPFGQRPRKTTSTAYGVSADAAGAQLRVSIVTVSSGPANFCVRSRSEQLERYIEATVGVQVTGLSGGIPIGTASNTQYRSGMTRTNTVISGSDDYIVVGLLGPTQSTPKEVILPIRRNVTTATAQEALPRSDSHSAVTSNTGISVELRHPRDLFQQIKGAEERIRPWYRRILSLKSVAAFGIYQCFPKQGYHRPVEIDNQTERTLALMFAEYQSVGRDEGYQWQGWVRKGFNADSSDPEEGHYSLQLILRWSPWRFIFWGLAPVILSLAIGFWFQYRSWGDWEPEQGDRIAIVQTAWTIASYIVTSAAVALASLAAITQFGHI